MWGLSVVHRRRNEVLMECIAEALIRMTQYINCRTDECTSDDDIKQLEEVAWLLGQCTHEERQLLIKVANRIGCPMWPEEIGIVE